MCRAGGRTSDASLVSLMSPATPAALQDAAGGYGIWDLTAIAMLDRLDELRAPDDAANTLLRHQC